MIGWKRGLIIAAAVVVMAGPAVFVAVRAQPGAATFADEQRVGENELAAGRLDIAAGERSVPIVAPNLAPGDIRLGSIELVNEGTAPLRFSVRGGTITDARALAVTEWLAWTTWWSSDDSACSPQPPAEDGGRRRIAGADLAAGGDLSGDARPGPDLGDRVLAVGETDVLCLEVAFSVEAPNSVQATTVLQSFVAAAEQLVAGGGG